MVKAEQFLWHVQTAVLSNQLLLARQIETRESKDFISLDHVHRVAARALWAASQIPEEVSASEAARDFCSLAFDNLWKEGDIRPEWLLGMPL